MDVAGHTAQLPQILQKAGIRGFVISAGSNGPALYNWQGRDGSSLLVWRTLWGYGAAETLGLRRPSLDYASSSLPRSMEEVRQNAAEHRLPKIGFIADGSDIQAPDARVVENIRKWNQEKRNPPITYASTAGLFAAVEKQMLPAGAGEMPSPWDTVQSQGNECFMVDRRLDGRVLAAEKLSAFASVILPSFAYPHDEFERIWENRLYVLDHNWGGWHGADNDRLKAEKIQQAAQITNQVLTRAVQSIAEKIDFKKPAENAAPIVVFNPLSWDRKDVVTVDAPRERAALLK